MHATTQRELEADACGTWLLFRCHVVDMQVAVIAAVFLLPLSLLRSDTPHLEIVCWKADTDGFVSYLLQQHPGTNHMLH